MSLFKPFDLNYIRQTKPSVSRVIEIDLSSANEYKKFAYSGDFIHVLECKGNAELYLNEKHFSPVDLRKIKRIKAPFYQFFIKSSAQPNAKLKLLLGVDASFQFEERRTSYTQLIKLDDESLTNAAGSTSHTINLAGFKSVKVYFDCNKNATVILYEYPLDSNVLADYTYSEQIGLVASDRKFTRVLNSVSGALQIAIYNEDSADDMTYDLIVTGEK